ncbi:MAG: hypothetical protein K2N41_05835, partial [Lachnospiraceae bacterium]|nr:hypothetical protein [Lachnospiraceae bacterium]
HTADYNRGWIVGRMFAPSMTPKKQNNYKSKYADTQAPAKKHEIRQNQARTVAFYGRKYYHFLWV